MSMNSLKIIITNLIICTITTSMLLACSQDNIKNEDMPKSNTIVSENKNTASAENEKENEQEKAEYKKISPEEAKKLLDNKEDVILLDVRTEEEYNTIHIPQSKLLPLDKLEEDAEDELIDKESVILVYCRSGNRSKTASKILIDLGYKNIYDLGGIKDWPYETESNK